MQEIRKNYGILISSFKEEVKTNGLFVCRSSCYMRKVQFKSKKQDGYLLIKSSGTRGSFMESVEAIGELMAIVHSAETRHILADYRDVNYTLGNSELFSITRYIETKQPDFRNITMAVVVSNSQNEVATFWENIFGQRGFKIRAFGCFEGAEKWIKSEIAQVANPDSHAK